MKRFFICIMAAFLTALMTMDAAEGASIGGKVYDLELNELDNVIIQINTTPRQQVITKGGGFGLEVPPGTYQLKATTYVFGEPRAQAEENITVIEDGQYVLDLVLFPLFEDFDDYPDIGNVEDTAPKTAAAKLLVGAGVAAIVIIGIIFVMLGRKFLRSRRKKSTHPQASPGLGEHAPDPAATQVIRLIRANDGQISQKELRKQLPWSEAKLSIVLTQLEIEGKVQKIRHGRVNSIVLRK